MKKVASFSLILILSLFLTLSLAANIYFFSKQKQSQPIPAKGSEALMPGRQSSELDFIKYFVSETLTVTDNHWLQRQSLLLPLMSSELQQNRREELQRIAEKKDSLLSQKVHFLLIEKTRLGKWTVWVELKVNLDQVLFQKIDLSLSPVPEEPNTSWALIVNSWQTLNVSKLEVDTKLKQWKLSFQEPSIEMRSFCPNQIKFSDNDFQLISSRRETDWIESEFMIKKSMGQVALLKCDQRILKLIKDENSSANETLWIDLSKLNWTTEKVAEPDAYDRIIEKALKTNK